MRRHCTACPAIYDDAERSTLCPHERFLTPGLQAQKDLGLSLFGKPLRWANESAAGEILRVQSVGWDGMVTLEGWTGEFAPHLFRVVEEPATDDVRRFLVTAPDENLITFHVAVAMRLNGIERREQTVIYTCMAEDSELALRAAERADVTLQEIAFTDGGGETYVVVRTGSHGLTWVRPSER